MLVSVYILGRRDGKRVEETKQQEKLLEKISLAKRIDDMSDSDIDRMPSKYD